MSERLKPGSEGNSEVKETSDGSGSLSFEGLNEARLAALRSKLAKGDVTLPEGDSGTIVGTGKATGLKFIYNIREGGTAIDITVEATSLMGSAKAGMAKNKVREAILGLNSIASTESAPAKEPEVVKVGTPIEALHEEDPLGISTPAIKNDVPKNAPPPTPTPVSSGKRKIVIVEASSAVGDRARDVADASLSRDKAEQRGIRGIVSKWWTQNVAKEFKRQREIARTREAILQNQNLYVEQSDRRTAASDADTNAHNAVMNAFVNRFIEDHEDLLHREAGEARGNLGESAEETTIKTDIKNLIREYALGHLNEAAFMAERSRIFNNLRTVRPEIVDQGLMYAENIFQIAKEYRQALEHGMALEELDFDFEIVLGRAKAGARTEAQYNAVDKIVDRLQSSRIGQLIGNETAIALGVGALAGVAGFFSQRFARSKIAAVSTLGASVVMGGTVAGLRESRMIEDDRRQHAREMAQGKSFDERAGVAPRRKEMQEYMYEMRSATEMTSSIKELLYTTDGKVRELSNDEFQEVLRRMSEAKARISISDRSKIDLIAYSDEKKVEEERLKLDLALAMARRDLDAYLAQDTSVAIRTALGDGGLQGRLNFWIETSRRQIMGGDQGVEAKNRMFTGLKRKKVAWAVFKGVAIGGAAGVVAQELGALITGKEGMLEGYLKGHGQAGTGTHHYTSLEYLRRLINGDLPHDSGLMGTHDVMPVPGGTHYDLPVGVDIKPDGHGGFDLIKDGEVISKHLELTPKGTLTADAQNTLDKLGITSRVEATNIITKHTTTLSHKDFLDYAKTHPEAGGPDEIRRLGWYDNKFPHPKSDLNELKLWWGGDHGTGIDPKTGDYVYSVKQMTADGSFHGKLSADAQALMKAGKLRAFISLDRATQGRGFWASVDTNGDIRIPHNSEVGKLAFETVKGHAVFKGGFTEIAQSFGPDKDGIEQVKMLATHVGKGTVGGVPIVDEIITHGRKIVMDVPPSDYDVTPPPFIPVIPRTPLERVKSKARPEPLQPEHPPGYSYSEHVKERYSDLNEYRNNREGLRKLVAKLEVKPEHKEKYAHVLTKIKTLESFSTASAKDKEKITAEYKRHNARYGKEITLEQYIAQELQRTYAQIENIYIEEANVGKGFR